MAESCSILSDCCFLTLYRASDSSGLESKYYLGVATAAMKRISVFLSKGSQHRDWGYESVVCWLQQCSWCQLFLVRLLVLTFALLLLKWSGLRTPISQLFHYVVGHFSDSNQSCNPGKILYQNNEGCGHGYCEEQKVRSNGRTAYHQTLGNKICFKKSRKARAHFVYFLFQPDFSLQTVTN